MTTIYVYYPTCDVHGPLTRNALKDFNTAQGVASNHNLHKHRGETKAYVVTETWNA